MKKILTPTNYELIPLNDKTNVRFFTSIDPGSYVAPHWHDAVEIVYLLEGELKVIVGNDSRNLKAGQCAMVTPNQIHSTLCTSPTGQLFFRFRKPSWKNSFPMQEIYVSAFRTRQPHLFCRAKWSFLRRH